MGLTNRQLDILDDGVRNYSSVGMTSNAQQLMINTITSPFDQGGVSHAEVWVNGVLHSTITAADMTRLPTGLVVDFDVTTLKLGETDYVQLKVFPTGGDQTPLTATLTVAEPPVMDGGDVLVGGAGEDSLYGQDGNDLLIGGQGRDLLDGGNGIDTASWDDSLSRVVVNLSNGQTKGGAKGDTLVSIENLIGSRFDDILTGDAGKNSLHGGAGNDRLVGGGGNDIFIFANGDGQDTIADFARKSKSEKIDLTDFDIASFAELKSMGTTVLGNAVFDFGGDDMLIIRGFSLADLNAGDFIL